MVRVIKHYGLSTVVIVGHGTGSFIKLTTEYKVYPAQLDGLLKTIALCFDCNIAVAEDLLCEAFRNKKAYDFQFRGQSIYHPVVNNDLHEEVEFMSSGEKKILPEITFYKPVFKQQFVNWWDPLRISDISLKHRAVKLYPTTSTGRSRLLLDSWRFTSTNRSLHKWCPCFH
jgi:hypothetical protein